MPRKPRKAGRPSLPKGEAKGRIMPVRFTPELYKAVSGAAKRKNVSISAWVREVLQTACISG
jgi:predicted HicB family RNase H-like nuclease